METGIQTTYDTLPVSFSDRREVKMTDPQKALVAFLKNKANSNEMITRADILDFYITHVRGGEYFKIYGQKPHPDPRYTHTIYDFSNWTWGKWRDQYNISSCAVTWFKNNLGSCILKGKLLAIPVIEIDK